MTMLKKGLCAAVAVLSAVAGSIGAASAKPSSYDAYSNPAIHGDRQMGGEGFRWRHGNAYFNGHRGFRERRRGYRYRNGYWFPEEAFLGGVVVGSTINGDLYRQHVRWCADRYRSYRESDDTFQPYHGPRLRCTSPYDQY